jgi:hypothetical protein
VIRCDKLKRVRRGQESEEARVRYRDSNIVRMENNGFVEGIVATTGNRMSEAELNQCSSYVLPATALELSKY